MHSVPEQKMRAAKYCNQYGRLLACRMSPYTQPRYLFEPGHRRQKEETRDCRDVMDLECREKVGSQREDCQRYNHPDEPVLPQAPKERHAGQVERREKEEAIETHAIFQ